VEVTTTLFDEMEQTNITSWVWKHFNKKEGIITCKYCNKEYKLGNKPTTLIVHLSTKHSIAKDEDYESMDKERLKVADPIDSLNYRFIIKSREFTIDDVCNWFQKQSAQSINIYFRTTPSMDWSLVLATFLSVILFYPIP